MSNFSSVFDRVAGTKKCRNYKYTKQFLPMFRFKQFTIWQDQTAMKVCTDACVLGAFANVSGNTILDIGTGTGLLALMAAQRNPTACVDAVELDYMAVNQATENIARSPFADRIGVWHGPIQGYKTEKQYDRILTNPPFYVNSLRSPDLAANRAHHADDLPFADLLAATARLLAPDGQWWVLLPPFEMAQLTALAAEVGLHQSTRLLLRHHAKKSVFRVVVGFRWGRGAAVSEQTLAIYEPDGRTFAPDFRALLQPFYLLF
jgi:tRNA1Val (adenine37-N6)-methyltransferase